MALALICAIGWTVGCAPHAVTTQPSSALATAARPYVVLLSIDGFRHDYLERFHPPALERLAAAGIRARALLPPFPSKTFPSHYTIATGLYPGSHGILGNNFFDQTRARWFRMRDTSAARDGSWYAGEPIWIAAEREAVKSAVYFWPGSEAQSHGMRPTYYKTFRASVPDTQRVDESLAWLRLPPAERPHLVLLYLNTVDDTTHRYGPETPHTAAVVSALDRVVERMLDGIARLPQHDSVNVVVLSDHGMADVRPDGIIPILPLLTAAGIDTARVRTGDMGPTMSLWFGDDDALRASALAALRERLQHARVYSRGATPAHWHLQGNGRAGDLIVAGEVGYVIAARATDRWVDRGTHGWDPAHESMHGIFVAAGPQVRQSGLVPAFDNVHVFPFLAALLGLEHAPRSDADPRVLAPYLRTSASD
ncbi:MAG: ectonucleotide pyrophosphatase/phosphodiesterase [Gemmatimonadaceae bacterium]